MGLDRGARSQPRGGVEADVAAVCAGPNFYDVEWAWRSVQSGLRNLGSADDPIFTRKNGPGHGGPGRRLGVGSKLLSLLLAQALHFTM